MDFLQRKMLQRSMEVTIFVKKPCIPADHCDRYLTTPPPLPPPPPPPRTQSFHQALSPFLIIMFCGLAVSLCFIFYLTCATRYRTRRRNNHNTNQETHDDFVNEDLGPVIHNPIWLINTIGLEQSLIDSIQVFKYKRDEKVVEGTDCSVCLSEFEDDEGLRLLPKCSHAFHVPCIDAWLRSHTNCPLCRAPIFKSTSDRSEHMVTESNSTESSSTHDQERGTETVTLTVTETETPVGCETMNDHHVDEVENNGEIMKTIDDHDVQGEVLVAMRRSFSNNMVKSENKFNESSSSLNICQKAMKSASVGHSLRKATSFTSKYRPHN